ncbi:hypothetical protein [Kibdelosporangium aridum]|uniref:Uncharacterized protein n=1 Tax=Kibdelosporangium aridum TaxID=2030 RepID=A0A1W2FSM8_KIBAR|nr:hypothetical protein [Kibdelosporangium aridum]SMD24636.1 hypothetical protein SAMN05661093_08692 [Kibdelosporangium aridum]
MEFLRKTSVRAVQVLAAGAIAGAVIGTAPAAASTVTPGALEACTVATPCYGGPYGDRFTCVWESAKMSKAYTVSQCYWSTTPWSGWWYKYWR